MKKREKLRVQEDRTKRLEEEELKKKIRRQKLPDFEIQQGSMLGRRNKDKR